MNKKQRWIQIQRYDGVSRIVFERRIKRLKANQSGEFECHLEYTINTKRIESVYAYGESPLQAVRKAWKRAKHAYEDSAAWYLKRGYQLYEYDEADVPQFHNIEHRGHLFGLDKDSYHHCQKCHQRYKDLPYSDCPEVPVFPGLWERAFKNAEDYFGFKPLTKRQLSDAGFQTGKQLPSPIAAVQYSENANGLLFLYSPDEATPKRTMSEAQKAALEHARYMAEIIPVWCIRCGDLVDEVTRKKSLSEYYQNATCSICDDRLEVGEWAHGLFENKDQYLILDTETTDLNGEVIELGVIDLDGNIVFDTRIKPVGEMSAGAYAVHGISLDDLANEPSFAEIYPKFIEAIGDKTLLIYNASFDRGILRSDCRLHSLPFIKNEAEDVMYPYSTWVGEWSNYWGNYKWQPLYGGDHSAIGDCRATLGVLREMSEGWLEWQKNTNRSIENSIQ